MMGLWKAIRYSFLGVFVTGIVVVIQGCSEKEAGVLAILLFLMQFCSGPLEELPVTDVGSSGESTARVACLVGHVNESLVLINPNDASLFDFASSSPFDRLESLTHDRTNNVLYAVTESNSNPKLVRIDLPSFTFNLVGDFDNGVHDYIVGEGLAYDNVNHILYGSAGQTTASVSDQLVTIDTTTGDATPIAAVTGTDQNEIDSMEFVGSTMYITDKDGTGAPTTKAKFYTIHLTTGVATLIDDGELFFLPDFTYDEDTDIIFAIHSPTVSPLVNELATVSPLDASATIIGETHASTEFDGARMLAIVWIKNCLNLIPT